MQPTYQDVLYVKIANSPWTSMVGTLSKPLSGGPSPTVRHLWSDIIIIDILK